MTIRGGGYSNAGQSNIHFMYQLGGYMTATNTYDAYEVRNMNLMVQESQLKKMPETLELPLAITLEVMV